MLRKLISSGPALSKGVARALALMTIVLYLIVFAKATTLFPEAIFRDAEKIQEMIGGRVSYEDSSFDAMARFYALLGRAGQSVFVCSVGALLIWSIVARTRRLGLLACGTVLLLPCLYFNVLVANKDTIVVLMSLVIAIIARRYSSRLVFLLVAALYVGYAMKIRVYYALILAISIGVYAFRKSSLRGRVVLALLGLIGAFLLPDAAYFALQHPRDAAVDFMTYGAPTVVRTSFYNPTSPDSFANFCTNYVYALLRLNLPVLFYPGPREFAMQLFVFIVLLSVSCRPDRGVSSARLASFDMLASLTIGHIAVSLLFEPDLGSYTRHLSSVSMFGFSLLALIKRQTQSAHDASLLRDARKKLIGGRD
jgi:hypothetical protein